LVVRYKSNEGGWSRSMKALEFQTKLSPDHNLRVPEDVALQIPGGEMVQVVVLVPDNADAGDWQRLTQEEFLRGYVEGDGIYDTV
jgi:hypothetical protein